MNTYIITIITISIVGGIVSSLVAKELKKHVNFIVGLICAIVLLSPIVSFLNDSIIIKNGIYSLVDSLNLNENLSNRSQYIVNTSIETVSEGIKKEIINRFDFNENDVEVNLNAKQENGLTTIDSVTITLQNKASWYEESKVKEYAEELVGCKVIIKKK